MWIVRDSGCGNCGEWRNEDGVTGAVTTQSKMERGVKPMSLTIVDRSR